MYMYAAVVDASDRELVHYGVAILLELQSKPTTWWSSSYTMKHVDKLLLGGLIS